MSDSVRPHRRQPTRLRRPWDSPGKNTGVGCHFLLQCMKVKSEVTQSCPTLSDPMDCSLPGSSIHGIFQARVLEGLPLPSPNSHDAGLSPCNSDQVIPADSPCLGANIMIRLTHLLFLHLQLQIQSPQSNTQYYVGSLLYHFSSFALSNTSHLYKCWVFINNDKTKKKDNDKTSGISQ